MIYCNNIHKNYAKHRALNGFSLHISTGEVVGLLGVNGAGKSTLIKIILGLTLPDTGDVTLNVPSVGYMPEIASMPETISPLAFIRFALCLRGAKKQDAEGCLKEIGLSDSAWHKPIRQLSKGMRQRTALAFALAGAPNFLILDEPMSGLDAIGRLHLIGLLQQRQKQGCGILICSHIVPDLVRLSHRVLLVGQGKVQEEFPLHDHNLAEIQMLESALSGKDKL